MGVLREDHRVNMKVICFITFLGAALLAVQAKPQGYAPADPYSYTYAVKDDYTNNNFGESASGHGDSAQGSYYVALPDGRLQTVKYAVAGAAGYVAEVAYSR